MILALMNPRRSLKLDLIDLQVTAGASRPADHLRLGWVREFSDDY